MTVRAGVIRNYMRVVWYTTLKVKPEIACQLAAHVKMYCPISSSMVTDRPQHINNILPCSKG